MLSFLRIYITSPLNIIELLAIKSTNTSFRQRPHPVDSNFENELGERFKALKVIPCLYLLTKIKNPGIVVRVQITEEYISKSFSICLFISNSNALL